MASKNLSNEDAKALLRTNPISQQPTRGTVTPSSGPLNKEEAKSFLRVNSVAPVQKSATPVAAKASPVKTSDARDVAVRQAFKARPVEVPKAEPVKTYTPNYASRLSGGGMNLAAEQVAPVMEKRADGGRRQNAGAATLGYSTLGMVPNFVETANQAIHNAWSDLHNKDYQDAKKDYKDVKSYSQGRLRAEMGVTTDKHEAKQQEFERLYAKADSLKDKTPVNQNRTGQKLMAKARESHEIATEGMSWFEKLLADTAISMYQNSPGIVLSAVTKNPTIGLLFMGSQAGSQKMAELNSRGIAPNEALVRGAASGAIEFATEKLPLENLLKIATGKAGQNFLKNVAKQAGMESVEEGIAYVGDALVDAMANDPEAQFSLSDLALAMAAGGLSGGFMSLGGTMVGGTSRKAADPVTEAMANSDDPATRTAAEVQKANPDTVVVTQEAEAMIAEGVKPAQAVEATRNVAAVTEGATGITSKQIEAILKDPKAAALFEQKSGIKLSASKAEARNQIKAYHAHIAEIKATEQVMPESVVEPIVNEVLAEQDIAPEMQEQVITEAETYEPYVQIGESEAQVNAPLDAVRQKLTEMVAPEKAEALLREYDAAVQKLGRAPRFAPYTEQSRNPSVEAFAENNDVVLKELGLAGIEVYYAPSRVDPDTGRRIKERGKFDRNRNVIMLNGATLQGQDAAAAIVSHELVHKAATKDTAIADRIISTYRASKGLTLDARYKEYALNYSGFIEGVDGAALKRMTPAEVSELLTAEQKAYLNEEIAADLMMQALGSKKQMEQFAKTGGRGVLEQVRGIIDRILSALGSGNAKLRVAYNNMLRDLDSVLKSTEAVESGEVAGGDVRASLETDLKASEQKVEKLEAKNEALKAEMKPSGGVRVDNNKAVRVTKDVLKRYKSGYDATDMQARIQDFYEAMLEDRYDWGEYDQIAYNIASDIVRASNVKQDILPEYQGVREYLRKTKLHVPDTLQSELGSVGGYNQFRKSNMGRLNLSGKNGLPVDVAYQELSKDYPGLFNDQKYSHPSDQLIHMVEVLGDIQSVGYDSAFMDMEGEIQALAQELTDHYADTLTDRPTKVDKIEQKIRAEYEALPFDKWLSDRLANNKASLVRDIIEQRSPSMLNSVDGKPVYLTTKEARALTNLLATLQTDLVSMQEEVKAVKVEKAKKVERVRKEAKVEANWTAAENKKRTDWLVAEAKHEGEVKVESQKELLEARMEKIHEENAARIEKIEARDAKRLAKVNKKLEEQKRKRRLSSVKGKDAAKTMRNYQSEKNKQKAVEDAGERFIANLPKTAEDKTFDQKLTEAKSKVRDGWDTARYLTENRLQEFDNFSSWENIPMTSALVKRAQNMPGMAYNILTEGYMTPDGDFGGAAFHEVIHIKDAAGKINREAQDIYNEYLYTMHNIDRMSFIERARDKVVAFETAHPEIAALDSEGIADVITARERSEETKAKKALAEEYTKLLKELSAAEDKPVLAWGVEGQLNVREAMTAEEARERADALREANKSWLVERSEALYAWWDKFIRDWAVGVQITEAEYEQMKKDYPHYVPTFREKETQGVAGGSTAGGGMSTASVFKPAKGSTKDLKRADDNFVSQVQKICNQRAMSDLCTWMMDQAYSDPDVFGDRVLVADPTGDADADVFADLDDRSSAADEMLKADKDGLYKLTTWRDGEKIEAYISKNMYRGFQSLTNANRVAWVEMIVKAGKFFTTPTKMAITGYSPSFMVRNPIMDFPTAVVNSTAGIRFPMYYAKAINGIRTNSEDWRRFRAMGGTQANFYNQEKGFEDNSRLAAKKGPLHGISKANEYTEGVTRFAEYLATIAKYGDTAEGRSLGIKNAAEVTVDFNRVGEVGRVANAWIPYQNPAIQGISRQLRLVFGGQQKSIQQRAANLGIVLTRATMVSLMPEIILQALYSALGEDEEWRKLTAWERGSNYCIPRHWVTGDMKDKGKFIKIPKSREWARYIGTPFMMMMDSIAGKENAFEGYFEQVLKPSVTPPIMPIGLQQREDLKTNETFTGAPIVPGPYQGLADVPGGRKEQWNEKTSKLAIAIGGMFNWSPMQIDYLTGSLFGNWGKFAMQMSGNPGLDANDSTVTEGMWYNFNNNFTKRFVADNVYSNATTSKFYDTYTKAEGAWKLEKLRGDDPENSIAYQTQYALSKYFDSISDINAEIRDLSQKPMPKKERDEKQRALRQSINVIAAEAMDFYNDIQSGKSKNPKLELQHKSLGVSAPVSKELTALKDVEGYNFQPVKSQKSIADPNKKGYEFELTDAQRLAYDAAYIKLYNATMETAIRRPSYLKADDKGKAEKLEAARDGVGSNESVGDKARRHFIAELKKQGIKSTKKQP